MKGMLVPLLEIFPPPILQGSDVMKIGDVPLLPHMAPLVVAPLVITVITPLEMAPLAITLLEMLTCPDKNGVARPETSRWRNAASFAASLRGARPETPFPPLGHGYQSL